MKRDQPAQGASSANRRSIVDARRGVDVTQTLSDADQSLADHDQSMSDSDQVSSVADTVGERSDDEASDRDQATADRDQARGPGDAASDLEYERSRGQRQTSRSARATGATRRSDASQTRDRTATKRDHVAWLRDDRARDRDATAAELDKAIGNAAPSIVRELDRLREEASIERDRAATERDHAAVERAAFAHERARLEGELMSSQMDALTGAYRRGMGHVVLANEIARARRGDARFVLAFVDVDDLKSLNDEQGHSAGDRALRLVVAAIRAKLRSFDPIVRHGGDEFLCGLGGTDVDEVEARFSTMVHDLSDQADVRFSFGLATLATRDTLETLTARADAALLNGRRRRAH